jgi:hypothetical protein
MTTIMPRKHFDQEAAVRALEQYGIEPTESNITKLVYSAESLDQSTRHVSEAELLAGAAKLASESVGTLRASDPIVRVISACPKELARYEVTISDDKRTLTFDPSRELSPVGARALRGRSIEVERTERGGARIQISNGDDPLQMDKGSWSTNTLANMLKSRPAELARLEEAGYNVNALRKVLVVKTDDGESTFFALRQENVDKPDPRGQEERRPGFANQDDPTRGLIAICSEVTIVTFDKDGPVFTVRKPVIYLYPEQRTTVRVNVEPNGEFIAQYPTAENGTWSMIATPDGTLFDPKTEKKYSYLFWEALNPGTLAIDREKAFCVRSAEVERFLENACAQLGLNDRERTDFISYWIAPLRRNPISLIQFLTGHEVEAVAKMTIEPKPNSEIRIFMMFQRVREMEQTGSPELPRFVRHRFTAVEWGGANLDE